MTEITDPILYILAAQSSFSSTGKLIPILTLREKHLKLLGAPYTKCRSVYNANGSHIPYKLFDYYSLEVCQYDCLLQHMEQLCHCRAPYINARLLPLRYCTFKEHIECVAPLIRSFHYEAVSIP